MFTSGTISGSCLTTSTGQVCSSHTLTFSPAVTFVVLAVVFLSAVALVAAGVVVVSRTSDRSPYLALLLLVPVLNVYLILRYALALPDPAGSAQPDAADQDATDEAEADAPEASVVLPDAGWYPNPEVPDSLRYWDGDRWTDHVAHPATVG